MVLEPTCKLMLTGEAGVRAQLAWNTWMRYGPPHSWLRLPPQGIAAHLLSSPFWAFDASLPPQHCSPYSTPHKCPGLLRLAAAQNAAQISCVITAVLPTADGSTRACIWF